MSNLSKNFKFGAMFHGEKAICLKTSFPRSPVHMSTRTYPVILLFNKRELPIFNYAGTNFLRIQSAHPPHCHCICATVSDSDHYVHMIITSHKTFIHFHCSGGLHYLDLRSGETIRVLVPKQTEGVFSVRALFSKVYFASFHCAFHHKIFTHF